ncbi:MAG: hypothetical protein KC496_02095 [Anaerolineae bacterium]|nr:hypothetical protein [Anaerolineae bacterium]
MLFVVKFLHTLVFLFMSACIFYMLYCGITGEITPLLWFAIGATLLETAVYALNGFRCPMTEWALRYGDSSGDDFIADIFLPKWFTPYITPICGGLMVIGLILIGWNLLL